MCDRGFSSRMSPSLSYSKLQNRQNNRVWAKSTVNVLLTEKVKFPGKSCVGGGVYRVLSHLHLIPKGQPVTAEYVEYI